MTSTVTQALAVSCVSDVGMGNVESVGWGDMAQWSEAKTCAFFREELGLVDDCGVREHGVNGKILHDLITSPRQQWQNLEKMMQPVIKVCIISVCTAHMIAQLSISQQ